VKVRLNFSVTDKGPGISRIHFEKIFERFYRIDKSRSRKDGGTGLGLSIVKHIMNLHEGKATVESEVGKGSIFSLKFPG
jgi:two-component system, OmpR family, phosphate regulon sensor histidine kinase PhoR